MTAETIARRRTLHVADDELWSTAEADELRRHLHKGKVGVVGGATVKVRRGKQVRRRGHFDPTDLKRGEYGKQLITYRGRTFAAWWFRTPTGDLGRLSMPDDVELGVVPVCHHVEEHADGTISVLPQPGNGNSILCGTWHGYVRRGVWERIG